MVETAITIPVFLFLSLAVFQLFFLAMAQIQLHYAAFYAARVGAVQNGDPDEVESAVKGILAAVPVPGIIPGRSIKVRTIERTAGHDDPSQDSDRLLTAVVQWDYPLLIPFMDRLFGKRDQIRIPGRPCLTLEASWTAPLFAPIPSTTENGDAP